MKKWSLIAIGVFAATMYALSAWLGLGHLHLLKWPGRTQPTIWAAWQAPDPDTLPIGPSGDSVRYGIHIFRETPWYAASYTGSRIACSDCHIEGGIAPYAIPLVGIAGRFPMYSKRAGHLISLQDRIEECFTRSENGRPLPYDSREMRALTDYFQWLSQPQPAHLPFVDQGLAPLPALIPNPIHGAQIYASQCLGCHGKNGAGSPPLFPPLWGPSSFNDGAGMNRMETMAAFVQSNMPQNRKGAMSAQDAWDVAAFIHAQPRPAFNPAYKSY